MNSTHFTSHAAPVPTRPPSRVPRVLAGCVLLVSSVVLVGLAGCFLIGVLALVRPELIQPGAAPAGVPRAAAPLADAEWWLVLTLYGFAFASLVGAVILFALGLRGLWPVLRGNDVEGDR